MIKKIKLFINNNAISLKTAQEITFKLKANGFKISNNNYDLAIAIGGDGAFLRMVKETNFNSNIYFIGINCGSLGFLQEVKLKELDDFILELKHNKYQIEEIGIQETIINYNHDSANFYSLNEIIIRPQNLKLLKTTINIDNNFLESFCGDGLLIATSSGSTAHNLSYGGSIVYNTFSSLQITPIAPLNSKIYKTLPNSIIIPNKKQITIIPEENQDLIITIDGENKLYSHINNIVTKIETKKIKCLRLAHYNFPQKINEKLLIN